MIGERLAEIRKDNGDTQANLAKRIGVSLPTVRSWEQEKSSPSHELLVLICRTYHISADYLLGLTDVDPAYQSYRAISRLNKSEVVELKNYEDYLIWRRSRKSKINSDDPIGD